MLEFTLYIADTALGKHLLNFKIGWEKLKQRQTKTLHWSHPHFLKFVSWSLSLPSEVESFLTHPLSSDVSSPLLVSFSYLIPKLINYFYVHLLNGCLPHQTVYFMSMRMLFIFHVQHSILGLPPIVFTH